MDSLCSRLSPINACWSSASVYLAPGLLLDEDPGEAVFQSNLTGVPLRVGVGGDLDQA